MVGLNGALAKRGVVIDHFAQHSVIGSCVWVLNKIFASQKLLLCSEHYRPVQKAILEVKNEKS